MTGAASAAPPRYPPNRTNGDGVWQKRYGPAGFGWYSIYGDFVGYNGYSWFNYGYPGYFRGGPAYPPGRTNFNRTDSYGFANFPR
ncbi:MAG TPA: hypothetical protein VHV77_07485, partial [Pirellulales bacterium]|jgi:hypothetical protein|nr:hypothetical protein [Pirellulales bacterium]